VTHARTEVIADSYSVSPAWLILGALIRSSSVPRIPRKFSARKVVVFENSPLSFKNDSDSQKTLLNYTLRRFSTVAFLLSLNVRVWDTSYLAVLPSAGAPFVDQLILYSFVVKGHAMVSSVLSWSLVPRVVKLLSLESSALLAPSQWSLLTVSWYTLDNLLVTLLTMLSDTFCSDRVF
jgi:hypothetical protein